MPTYEYPMPVLPRKNSPSFRAFRNTGKTRSNARNAKAPRSSSSCPSSRLRRAKRAEPADFPGGGRVRAPFFLCEPWCSRWGQWLFVGSPCWGERSKAQHPLKEPQYRPQRTSTPTHRTLTPSHRCPTHNPFLQNLHGAPRAVDRHGGGCCCVHGTRAGMAHRD